MFHNGSSSQATGLTCKIKLQGQKAIKFSLRQSVKLKLTCFLDLLLFRSNSEIVSNMVVLWMTCKISLLFLICVRASVLCERPDERKVKFTSGIRKHVIENTQHLPEEYMNTVSNVHFFMVPSSHALFLSFTNTPQMRVILT